ncbi:MAG: DUF4446 family protein [Butyrivibrio sp.]|nr:DUF4446 family protein [Butyrivibrio sp.]
MLDFFGLFQFETLYAVLGLAAFAVILLVIIIVLQSKIKKLGARMDKFMVGEDTKSLESVMTTRFSEIDELKKTAGKHNKRLSSIEEEMVSVYKKVGIVKYDAFNEMGGKLSFALAMLDKSNNGYVINAIHSREGCYTYAKEIVKGESYITLGEEEKKALEKAINSDSTMTD